MGQLLTIAWLRLRLFRNRLRGPGSAARAVGWLGWAMLGVLASVGITVGLTVLVALSIEGGDGADVQIAYRVVFYTCMALGVVLPVLLQGGVAALEVDRLRPYPVSPTRLYAFVVGASVAAPEHLLYVPVLLATAVVGIVKGGLGWLASLAIVAGLLACLVVWSHLVGQLIQMVFRSRRSRELLTLFLLIFLVTLSILPAAFEDAIESGRLDLGGFLRDAGLVRAFGALPPGIAADALGRTFGGEPGLALPTLGWLGAWLFVGIVLGRWAFVAAYRGDAGGGGPARRPRRRRAPDDGRPGPLHRLGALLPAPVLAIAAKDWRYMQRSVLGKFMLVAMPFFVGIFGMVLAGDSANFRLGGYPVGGLAVHGLVVYVALTLNTFLFNSFAWESSGVQAYFLGPVTLRQVLIGKNVGAWTFCGLIYAISIALWALLVGIPETSILVAAIFLALASMLAITTIGNVVSLAFPEARSVSGMKNMLSTGGGIASIGTFFFLSIQSSFCVAIPMFLGLHGWEPAFTFLLLVGHALLYVLMLGPTARWMSDRRELLVSRLGATE